MIDVDPLFDAAGLVIDAATEEWVVPLDNLWIFGVKDHEQIPTNEEQAVANLFIQYGKAGLIYWVFHRRNSWPIVKQTKRTIELIEDMMGLI